MLKRYLLASVAAGLALGSQLAFADPQQFYPGHGWLSEPPLSQTESADRIRLAGKIPAPSESEAAKPEARSRFCAPEGLTHPLRPLEGCGY